MVAAFTLVETLTALVLLSISFGFTLMVFISVNQSYALPTKNLAMQTVKEIRTTTLAQQSYINATLERNDFTIKKIVQPHAKLDQLIELQFHVFSPKEKLIYFHQEYIFIE